MIEIYADGALLFSTERDEAAYTILSPSLKPDINGAGSLTFVLPPGNGMHGGIQKLKSIITYEEDGKVLFRGRVLDDERDFYNQKNVYCEGDRSFLLDSLSKPYTYYGTVHDYFRKLVAEHNSQVEADKRFTVGEITAIAASATMEAQDDTYADTSSRMETRLLGAYGGYIRTRTEGGTTYLDWLTKTGDANGQDIEFSVNMLDLKDKMDASDVFTVLIPLGANNIGEDGEYTQPVNIASVNGGLDYIQDDEAVALYGKIWRTQTWSNEEDPAKLLEKAKAYMKMGAALQTLTLKAVDMHFTDASKKKIWVGDFVHILSDPHGLDITMQCVQMEVDPFNPEKTTYTFGEPPRTLTENFIQTREGVDSLTGGGRGGGGGRGIKEEASDILRWAKIQVDEDKAKISLLAGEKFEDIDGTKSLKEAYVDIDGARSKIAMVAGQSYESIDGSKTLNKAYIDIEGAKSKISLVAGQEFDAIDGTKTITGAYLAIDGQNSVIESKVSKDGVISSINQSAEAVTINASKINLNGYVTASQLTSELAALENGIASEMYIGHLSCGTFTIGGTSISFDSQTVCYGGSVSAGSTSASYSVKSGGETIGSVIIPSSWTFKPSTTKIYYLSWE